MKKILTGFTLGTVALTLVGFAQASDRNVVCENQRVLLRKELEAKVEKAHRAYAKQSVGVEPLKEKIDSADADLKKDVISSIFLSSLDPNVLNDLDRNKISLELFRDTYLKDQVLPNFKATLDQKKVPDFCLRNGANPELGFHLDGLKGESRCKTMVALVAKSVRFVIQDEFKTFANTDVTFEPTHYFYGLAEKDLMKRARSHIFITELQIDLPIQSLGRLRAHPDKLSKIESEIQITIPTMLVTSTGLQPLGFHCWEGVVHPECGDVGYSYVEIGSTMEPGLCDNWRNTSFQKDAIECRWHLFKTEWANIERHVYLQPLHTFHADLERFWRPASNRTLEEEVELQMPTECKSLQTVRK